MTLFALTLLLGIVSVLAGIGGGLLFVPLFSWITAFIHIDFIRGVGLMIALSGALAAGPQLMRRNLVPLRLALPVALAASLGAVFGAHVGLAMSATMIHLFLGVIIIAAAALIPWTPTREGTPLEESATHVAALGIEARWFDSGTRRYLFWRPRRLPLALLLFVAAGFMAGMFGVGGGWANVPILNLVLGMPLRLAVATSYFLLAIVGSSASWVYFREGALIPLLVVPSVLGVMLGARIGVWILARARTRTLRVIVVGMLLIAGVHSLLKGMGW